ncbi:MAG: hypothetical protein KKF24_05760 [Gammaproteobacteria bacterium]|nr:hypothetical protein [Gammaproteobacteria bacterium]MBU1832184.1 hypothetical protein [Gammaproteobacteria bacterium]
MKARISYGAIILSLFICGISHAQTRDFSSAHKKIERALEGTSGFPGSDAIWVKHDVLLIAVAKGAINEKKYAKQVCSFLNTNGFASQKVSVIIVDQAELRNRNQWSQLAEAQCK